MVDSVWIGHLADRQTQRIVSGSVDVCFHRSACRQSQNPDISFANGDSDFDIQIVDFSCGQNGGGVETTDTPGPTCFCAGRTQRPQNCGRTGQSSQSGEMADGAAHSCVILCPASRPPAPSPPRWSSSGARRPPEQVVAAPPPLRPARRPSPPRGRRQTATKKR